MTEPITYKIPLHLVSPLINDDPTGLSDSEEQELEKFLLSLPRGYFTLKDQVEPEFSLYSDVNNLGGDCLELNYIQI